MYRKQVRRRRAVLVLLVVACLILISTHFSEGDSGPLHSLQNGISAVLGPIEDGASRALKPARDLINWFDETFQARGENDDLKTEVDDLRAQLVEAEGAVEENEKLRAAAKLTSSDELASFTDVGATVIGRSPSSWNQVLTIDKGSSSGVEVDDAVVTGDGLIGRISATTGGTARVTLLTDQQSAVTARVLPGGPEGIVGPEVGDPNSLLLDLIESEKDVAEKAKLVTAGFTDGPLSSRFPAGIPIGEVSESIPAIQELSRRIRVEPYADLADLTVVTVLTGGAG